MFGPQPLAIKLKNGRYYHDNLDFGLTKGEWFYTFSEHNFPKKNVNILAIGAADKFGNFHTCKIKYKNENSVVKNNYEISRIDCNNVLNK